MDTTTSRMIPRYLPVNKLSNKMFVTHDSEPQVTLGDRAFVLMMCVHL